MFERLRKNWQGAFAIIAASLALSWYLLNLHLKIGLNADAIYPFSIVKDILTGVPLYLWKLPANPFLFPDILVSFFLVLFFSNLTIWFVVATVFGPLLLATVNSLAPFRLRELSFSQQFIISCYVTILVYGLCSHLFPANWPLLANVSFLFAHHYLGAIFSLAYGLWFTAEINQQAHSSVMRWSAAIIFFLCSFSDPFFFCYFCAFVLAGLLLNGKLFFTNRGWMKQVGIWILLGILAIALNWKFNHSVVLEAHRASHSRKIVENIKFVYSIVGGSGMFLLLGIPTFLLALTSILFFLAPADRKRQYKTLQIIALGLVLISSGLILAGLIKDPSHLRYAGILFAGMILIFSNLTPKWILSQKIVVSVSSIIFFVVCFNFLRLHRPLAVFSPQISHILTCQKLTKHSDALVLAEYWVAKNLYEGSNRRFRLLQTDPRLAAHLWMSNPLWSINACAPLETKKVFITVARINPIQIKKLFSLPNAYSHCEGEVIEVPYSKALIAVVPALSLELNHRKTNARIKDGTKYYHPNLQ